VNLWQYVTKRKREYETYDQQLEKVHLPGFVRNLLMRLRSEVG
jgi:hypothetical protein